MAKVVHNKVNEKNSSGTSRQRKPSPVTTSRTILRSTCCWVNVIIQLRCKQDKSTDVVETKQGLQSLYRRKYRASLRSTPNIIRWWTKRSHVSSWRVQVRGSSFSPDQCTCFILFFAANVEKAHGSRETVQREQKKKSPEVVERRKGVLSPARNVKKKYRY